jgi:hypothetical protein
MSLPGAPMAAAATLEALNPLESIISGFNTNPYFIGTMMLLLNLGGRFLAMEVSKEQEKFFSNPWIRGTLFFVVIFVATRNIIVAFWLSLFVVLLVKFLFNENSILYIFKKEPMKEEFANTLTPEEHDIYKKLGEKLAKAQQQTTEKEKEAAEQDIISTEMTYLTNMGRLQV